MLKKIIISVALVAVAFSSSAQLSSSLSSFSPYTMYGLGDLSVGGTAASRAMGGLGVAVRSPYEFNYQNPASLSAIPRNTAIFNLGAVSSNYYQSSDNLNTAYNSVDLNDLAFAIPLYKGIGFGVSLTPMSSVGFNTMLIGNNQSVIENIGRSIYTFYGEGGISQLSASLGVRVFKGFSLGATMNYMFGSIDRHWTAELYSLIDNTIYRRVNNIESLTSNQLTFTVGFQYEFRVGDDDILTIGATYAPKTETDFKQRLLTYTGSENLYDTVAKSNNDYPMVFPEKISGGIYFKNTRFGIGFDYSYQDWSGAFAVPKDISLGVANDYRFGAQYTPDRYSIRSFFSRITYRIGARYATSYLRHNDLQYSDWAITCGFDIPLKMRNFSSFNLGIEYGQRGTKANIIKEEYFKVFIGVSLFGGDDMWFKKRKFN